MIDRQRNILDFSLSLLLRRKGKNAALFLCYTLIVALLASVMFLTHAVRREAVLILQDSPSLVVQRLLAGRSHLIPLAYQETIQAIPGVDSVTGRLWGYYFDAFAGANYTVMAPRGNPIPTGTVTIGEGVARTRRLAVGDLFPLQGSDGLTRLYQVAGLLPRETSLVSADLLLLAEGDFRTLFAIPPGVVTDLVLTLQDPATGPAIARQIVEALPDTRPLVKAGFDRTYDLLFSWRSGVLSVIMASALLSFLIFSWDKASGLSPEERSEIGLLKALGWDTSDLLLLKVWEGVIISFSAFITGVLLAYGHVFLSRALLFRPILQGWSVLSPEFRPIPFINGYQVVALCLLTVLPYTVATILPAWRAATIEPETVMRGAG